MIRILHILSSLDGGGVESLLYSYYKNMDRNKFRFDFAILDKKIGKMEPMFQKLGTTIYRLPPKREGLIKSLKVLDSIMKENRYDIVHSHQNMNAIFAMFIAFKNRIPVRIAHSHYGNIPHAQFLEKQSIRFFLRPFLKMVSTHRFACSKSAAISLWGKFGSKDVTILYNAIDLKNFVYDEKKRETSRKIFDVTDKFVIGCVARLNPQKNLLFLLNIVKQLSIENSDVKLIIVGDGEQRGEVEEYIIKNNLEDLVILLGNRNDVSDIIKCFDVFVLPSAFEGLGIVFIEAQAVGIYTLASDKVPQDTNITDLISYLSIDDEKIWVEKIRELMKREKNDCKNNKKKYNELIKEAHYDIACESRRLEQLYTSVVEGY